jgi:Cu/Ag efflux protein CusF
MKTQFQLTSKIGGRLLCAFAVAALAGSTLASCSNTQSGAPAENTAPAATNAMSHDEMSHDKASAPKTYRDIGARIVSINQPAKNVKGAKTTVTLDHEAIPNFMRAMRMTVPLQDAADAKQLKAGHKIRCDFVMENGSPVLAHIRVLPADTKLKLAPA